MLYVNLCIICESVCLGESAITLTGLYIETMLYWISTIFSTLILSLFFFELGPYHKWRHEKDLFVDTSRKFIWGVYSFTGIYQYTSDEIYSLNSMYKCLNGFNFRERYIKWIKIIIITKNEYILLIFYSNCSMLNFILWTKISHCMQERNMTMIICFSFMYTLNCKQARADPRGWEPQVCYMVYLPALLINFMKVCACCRASHGACRQYRITYRTLHSGPRYPAGGRRTSSTYKYL